MDSALEPDIDAALDRLLAALRLEPAGPDRFRAGDDASPLFDRIYGGQLLAQAIVAAGATVATRDVSAVHAVFVEAGDTSRGLDLAVDRVRDGRSLATRRVTVLQGERPLLSALVSFHTNPAGPDVHQPAPAATPPDQMPSLQHWARELPPELRAHGEGWIARPPALDIRIGEPLTFLGGRAGRGPRSHWMRLPRAVDDDPVLHAALLAYGSDFFLMDMIFRAHPDGPGPGRFSGYSLDHAMWLHRRPDFTGWHLHTQEALAVVGDRGLARGSLHEAEGRLVATVMQEVVVRPLAAS
jgi:acyl-CoA thioesterase-2